MSKRIMLPFAVDIYPLAVLAEDAVILGAASDHSTNDVISTTPGTSSLTQSLDFSTLERTVSCTVEGFVYLSSSNST